jgi:hypothetical protein
MPIDRTYVPNPGHEPKKGDVIRIPSRIPLVLELTAVRTLKPGHWDVHGKILEGKGVGGREHLNLFAREFEYVRKS